MALVKEIALVAKQRQEVHEPVECAASIFRDRHGNKLIQLDTFGSADRKLKGKVSQSIQLTETAAAQLKELIEETFPDLE